MCALVTVFLIEHSAISTVIFICQYSLPPHVKEQEYEQVTIQGASLANVVCGKYHKYTLLSQVQGLKYSCAAHG